MAIYNDTYCVYIHTNKINGKKYVGQTINGNNPNKRWDNGRGYEHCIRFFNAIKKYGWDNFEHEIIASNLTAKEADNFERTLIAKLNTTNPEIGYNIELGGVKNRVISEATRKKISESHIGSANPMYGVRLTGNKNGMYGKQHSEETKKKISDAISGENHPNYGKPMNDERKLKISQSKLGKYTGENNPFYGKHHSEESKKMIGDPKRGSKNFNAQKIVQTDDSYNVIQVWECIVDASKELNIIRQGIWNALNGIRKHAGEYCWFYVYDRIRKDGSIILGAISLGYITEDDINVKNIGV